MLSNLYNVYFVTTVIIKYLFYLKVVYVLLFWITLHLKQYHIFKEMVIQRTQIILCDTTQYKHIRHYTCFSLD